MGVVAYVYWHPVAAIDQNAMVTRQIEPLTPALDEIARLFPEQWAKHPAPQHCSPVRECVRRVDSVCVLTRRSRPARRDTTSSGRPEPQYGELAGERRAPELLTLNSFRGLITLGVAARRAPMGCGCVGDG
jgi:hypothetical protein